MRGFHPLVGYFDLAGDAVAKCLISQGPEHYFTHEGEHFILAHHFTSVANGAFARILFTTGDEYFHATFFGAGTAGIIFRVSRNDGFTNVGGNALTAINRNDASSKVGKTVQACHTPGGSGLGSQVFPPLPIGAGGNPAQSTPGIARDANEFILKPHTAYVIEAESLADANRITIGCDYYHRGSHKPLITTTTTTTTTTTA